MREQYSLILHSKNALAEAVPNQPEDVRMRHDKLLECLRRLDGGWGLVAEDKIKDLEVTEFDPANYVSFSRGLGVGHFGYVGWTSEIWAKARPDHRHGLSFWCSAKRMQVLEFVSNQLPDLLSAFSTYIGSVFPDGVLLHATPYHSNTDSLKDLKPVNVWSEDYCQAQMGISAAEVRDRIIKDVELAELYHDGLIVVADSRAIMDDSEGKLFMDHGREIVRKLMNRT